MCEVLIDQSANRVTVRELLVVATAVAHGPSLSTADPADFAGCDAPIEVDRVAFAPPR